MPYSTTNKENRNVNLHIYKYWKIIWASSD